jgi:uncharacterized protein YjbI with pentapeptide repeats
MPALRCEVILTSEAVLAKGTPTLEGTVISADFHEYRNCETFSDVQFACCSFQKNVRIAGSTFTNCVFYNCSFSSDFFDCKFINCKFTECEFWQLSMTNITLESSVITDSDFQYCHCWAVTGGTMSDCAMFFCKLLCVDTSLENCQLEYVSIDPEPDDN